MISEARRVSVSIIALAVASLLPPLTFHSAVPSSPSNRLMLPSFFSSKLRLLPMCLYAVRTEDTIEDTVCVGLALSLSFPIILCMWSCSSSTSVLNLSTSPPTLSAFSFTWLTMPSLSSFIFDSMLEMTLAISAMSEANREKR